MHLALEKVVGSCLCKLFFHIDMLALNFKKYIHLSLLYGMSTHLFFSSIKEKAICQKNENILDLRSQHISYKGSRYRCLFRCMLKTKKTQNLYQFFKWKLVIEIKKKRKKNYNKGFSVQFFINSRITINHQKKNEPDFVNTFHLSKCSHDSLY